MRKATPRRLHATSTDRENECAATARNGQRLAREPHRAESEENCPHWLARSAARCRAIGSPGTIVPVPDAPGTLPGAKGHRQLRLPRLHGERNGDPPTVRRNLPRQCAQHIVLVGGTGTGKTHLAIALARRAIHQGKRARFYSVVDLVNQLDAEKRAGRAGRLA
ncbi:MAG: ATP-binding protein, partial [Pseudomonadales bacterium]|nr:ATP-binding protein [Pseudomonadales bacterium]